MEVGYYATLIINLNEKMDSTTRSKPEPDLCSTESSRAEQ